MELKANGIDHLNLNYSKVKKKIKYHLHLIFFYLPLHGQ